MRVNVLVDSCGWIEYFGGGPLADKYAPHVTKANRENYYTSTIVLYEVYKRMSELSEERALEACAFITSRTNTMPVNGKLALSAADVSVKQELSMADAIIKATADLCKAKIVTSDKHLGKLDDVKLIV